MKEYLKKCLLFIFFVLIFCSVCGSDYAFVQPHQLEYPGDEFISLLPTFVINKSTTSRDTQEVNKSRFAIYLRRMVYSLFSESTGTPLHFIFLTDENSKDILIDIFHKEVGRVTTRKFLTGYKDESEAQTNWKLPRFKVDLLSIDYFTEHHKLKIDDYVKALCPEEFSFIIQLKNTNKKSELMWLGGEICEKAFKWVQFLIADVLPSSFQKMIVLDVDIRFRSDVSSLYEYFTFMSKSEKVGLAKDWSDMTLETSWYRGRSPQGLNIGEPGPFTQNLNSAVVLLDLKKIRKDLKTTASIFNIKKIKSYIANYNIPTWGDQIIYTLLRWKEINQVYILPCMYNYQTLILRDQNFDNDHVFEYPYCQGCKQTDYHECRGKAKIEHLRNDRNLKDLFPTLFKYNNYFKFSSWCDDSQWTHCF